MERSSDPADTLRDYYDPDKLTLDSKQGEYEDGEIALTGTVDGSDARIICRPVAVVLTEVQSTVLGVSEQDSVAFEAAQGRGNGEVTKVNTPADSEKRIIISRDDGHKKFALIHHGTKQNVTAEIGEYNPEDNAYEWWPIGAVTDISVQS